MWAGWRESAGKCLRKSFEAGLEVAYGLSRSGIVVAEMDSILIAPARLAE